MVLLWKTIERYNFFSYSKNVLANTSVSWLQGLKLKTSTKDHSIQPLKHQFSYRITNFS